MHHALYVLGSIIIALALLVIVSVPVYANGRVQRLVTQSAGPYTLAIGTIPDTPVVGNLHLTTKVADEISGTSILGAVVTIAGTGPGMDTPEIGPLVAEQNPLDPIFYDTNMVVNREGLWRFMIHISGELGDASTEFDIEVTTVSPIAGIVSMVVLVAFLLILSLSLRAFLKQQRKESGRSRGSRRLS